MSEPSAEDRLVCRLKLRLGGAEVEVEAHIPAGPIRLADILPIFQRLTDAFLGSVVAEVERRGRRIPCRAGCGVCCRQPVPAAEAEAVYLAELVEAMPPERRAAVRQRFVDALARLEQDGLLDRLRGMFDLPDVGAHRALAAELLREQIACPFLDEEACSIYPHRPLRCREHLVLSPPLNCARRELKIDKLILPAEPSLILYRFGDGRGRDKMRWVPLLLALEWVERNREVAARTFPGPRLFENFLRELCRAQQRAGVPEGDTGTLSAREALLAGE
jgi:Fe-S-cluster containining protein